MGNSGILKSLSLCASRCVILAVYILWTWVPLCWLHEYWALQYSLDEFLMSIYYLSKYLLIFFIWSLFSQILKLLHLLATWVHLLVILRWGQFLMVKVFFFFFECRKKGWILFSVSLCHFIGEIETIHIKNFNVQCILTSVILLLRWEVLAFLLVYRSAIIYFLCFLWCG
jgi:hypothetical protein